MTPGIKPFRPDGFDEDLSPQSVAVYQFLSANRDVLMMADTVLKWGGEEMLAGILHGISGSKKNTDFLAWCAYEANAHHSAASLANIVRRIIQAQEDSLARYRARANETTRIMDAVFSPEEKTEESRVKQAVEVAEEVSPVSFNVQPSTNTAPVIKPGREKHVMTAEEELGWIKHPDRMGK